MHSCLTPTCLSSGALVASGHLLAAQAPDAKQQETPEKRPLPCVHPHLKPAQEKKIVFLKPWSLTEKKSKIIKKTPPHYYLPCVSWPWFIRSVHLFTKRCFSHGWAQPRQIKDLPIKAQRRYIMRQRLSVGPRSHFWFVLLSLQLQLSKPGKTNTVLHDSLKMGSVQGSVDTAPWETNTCSKTVSPMSMLWPNKTLVCN